MWLPAILAVALVALVGCGGEDPPLACIEPVSTMCAPLYPPTFDNIYTMTLAPKCGAGGGACHSDAGNKGGMSMSSIERAYTELLEPEQMRVVPGDPMCSEMIIRVTAQDAAIKMPRGVSLLPAEQCALIQWVADGAAR